MDEELRPLDIALAVSADAPACARAELTGWLARGCAASPLIDDARLLVSELVSNCVRHARIGPDELLRLTASQGAESVHVELHDAGTAGTVAWRAPDADDGAGGGFGLDLVAQLSSAWGVERDAGGTTVWLDLTTTPHREQRTMRITTGDIERVVRSGENSRRAAGRARDARA
jgi:anti-sigma regulatory factor (Ser/Thr protein kinase)